MKDYLYKLILPERLHKQENWTDEDTKTTALHFEYLQKALAENKLIVAGRTDEPFDKTFGLAIFKAANDDEAKAFMENDPAVKAGVMKATLHPYRIALIKE